MSTSATRVVLADDEVLMREGSGLLERSGFEVVGQSRNASELIDLHVRGATTAVSRNIRRRG
jgi:DNA-binding NarL/FixJ family response regulator